MIDNSVAIDIITGLSNLGSSKESEILRLLAGNKKSDILYAYKNLELQNKLSLSPTQKKQFLHNIRMKKVRTISGVTPVTVLTKPFPCPGKCIFCPNDVRMPKSYLADEPGAQRAESNKFDPYLQTFNRLVALHNIGHPVDKIELIILGGTWTAYPNSYRIWFVKRCFDALNAFADNYTALPINPDSVQMPYDTTLVSNDPSTSYNTRIANALTTREEASWEDLFVAHKDNEQAVSRCVGLVIETRPDEINPDVVTDTRRLGATKVQLGVQSLDDTVLTKNKRGHTVEQTAYAFSLLREAGFKLHIHWMPNLYGSTPDLDIFGYRQLFDDPRFRPDEVKIYPCSLIAGTELMSYYQQSLWAPYDHKTLLHVLSENYQYTPRYCRITRMIRDIPGNNIVAGNKTTNLRQLVEQEIINKGSPIKEIRMREVRDTKFSQQSLVFKQTTYAAGIGTEYFLEYVTDNDLLIGFLRLSLSPNRAMIREIHIYGQSIAVGSHGNDSPQHLGLGRLLIEKACELAKNAGYTKISVISSVGTRFYYRNSHFQDDGLYQTKNIT